MRGRLCVSVFFFLSLLGNAFGDFSSRTVVSDNTLPGKVLKKIVFPIVGAQKTWFFFGDSDFYYNGWVNFPAGTKITPVVSPYEQQFTALELDIEPLDNIIAPVRMAGIWDGFGKDICSADSLLPYGFKRFFCLSDSVFQNSYIYENVDVARSYASSGQYVIAYNYWDKNRNENPKVDVPHIQMSRGQLSNRPYLISDVSQDGWYPKVAVDYDQPNPYTLLFYRDGEIFYSQSTDGISFPQAKSLGFFEISKNTLELRHDVLKRGNFVFFVTKEDALFGALVGPQKVLAPPQLLATGVENFSVSQFRGGELVVVYEDKATHNARLLRGRLGTPLVLEPSLPAQNGMRSPVAAVNEWGGIEILFEGADQKVYYTNDTVSPQSDFVCTPTEGDLPLRVNCQFNGGGAVASYIWTWGDGATSTGPQGTHLYDKVGWYSVKLEVHGPGGSSTIEKPFYIRVNTPGKQFQLTSSWVVPGQKNVRMRLLYANDQPDSNCIVAYQFGMRWDPTYLKLVQTKVSPYFVSYASGESRIQSQDFNVSQEKGELYGDVYISLVPFFTCLPKGPQVHALDLYFDVDPRAPVGASFNVEFAPVKNHNGDSIYNTFVTFDGHDALPFLKKGSIHIASQQQLDTLAFIRGDSDRSKVVDLSDAIATLLYLFHGDPIGNLVAADVDDSGVVDITDPIQLLQHLYLGGTEPASPFPEPGLDPTP